MLVLLIFSIVINLSNNRYWLCSDAEINAINGGGIEDCKKSIAELPKRSEMKDVNVYCLSRFNEEFDALSFENKLKVNELWLKEKDIQGMFPPQAPFYKTCT